MQVRLYFSLSCAIAHPFLIGVPPQVSIDDLLIRSMGQGGSGADALPEAGADHAGGRSTENNVNALQFTCDSDPSRRWFVLEMGDAVQIKNVQTGKCLTIAGGRSTENNVNALQFTCDSDPSRRWRMKSVGTVFQIENVQTGKCLTIAGGRSTENNVNALQFTCDSDPSRTWRFQSGQSID